VLESQTFWPVESEQGAPDLYVCMECLDEVFRSKVPIQGCPSCGAVSAFEAFTLESIQEWGTEDLIAKARSEANVETVSPSDSEPTVYPEEPLPT
jgi:ribosomal protein L37AE/L43A